FAPLGFGNQAVPDKVGTDLQQTIHVFAAIPPRAIAWTKIFDAAPRGVYHRSRCGVGASIQIIRYSVAVAVDRKNLSARSSRNWRVVSHVPTSGQQVRDLRAGKRQRAIPLALDPLAAEFASSTKP